MKASERIQFTLKKPIVANVSVTISVRPDMAAIANNQGIDAVALQNLVEMKLDNIMAVVAAAVGEPLQDNWF